MTKPRLKVLRPLTEDQLDDLADRLHELRRLRHNARGRAASFKGRLERMKKQQENDLRMIAELMDDIKTIRGY